MVGALGYGYLIGWIVTSVVAARLSGRLRDEREPAQHGWLMSVAAGAAWPILVLAVAQAAIVALGTEVLHDREHPLTVNA